MARFVYSLVFVLAMPLVLFNLYLKSKDSPAYRKRWREHFGYFHAPERDKCIWVHAVSVGESLAAIPIIKRLQKEYPEFSVVVTTTTPTGAERIQAALGESVLHLFSPYDFPWVVKRFLRKIKPSLTIIMETELWPNFIHFCRKRKIPMVVVNARLSARSARSYARLPIPTKKLLLEPMNYFACQGENDARRFARLGASKQQLKVTGSVKFDLQPPDDLERRSHEMFDAWQNAEFIWVAGSTHLGEDEPVLAAQRRLIDLGIKARLILVPRHPERFESVSELITQRGFSLYRRSSKLPLKEEQEIYLCDSMGELMYCYQAANVAFIGGSFIDRGGHNPLEPANLGKPVLTGKHFFNFADVYKNMLDAKAAKVIEESELADVLVDFCRDENLRNKMGKAGLKVVASNRGAIAKTMKILDELLKPIR